MGLTAFVFLNLFYYFLWTFLLNLPQLELDNLDSLSASLKLSGLELESSKRFNKLANELMKRKLREDPEDVFYAFDTTITADKTELKIPNYIGAPEEERLARAPFDPRFTLAAYYQYLIEDTRPLKKIALPFHWSDWVDLHQLNSQYYKSKGRISCKDFDHRQYENETYSHDDDDELHRGAADLKDFCRDTLDKNSAFEMRMELFAHGGRMLPENAILAGKAYLYTSAPNPISILFLTKEGFYHIPLLSTRKSILQGNAVAASLAAYKNTHELVNTLDLFLQLKKIRPVQNEYVVEAYEVSLSHEDFVLDIEKLQDDLENTQRQKNLTMHEYSFQRSIEESLAKGKEAPKYFSEAKVYDSPIGDHYDWRFFNGIAYHNDEKPLILHRMTRSWLSFTRKVGLKTWVAHGSLLAWQFNGMGFPWDDDVDVQMPIQEFLSMCRHFNQTMVVEDTEDGFGRYFLDCATYVTQRAHGNGNNNIDARFIDVDSGFYIDITALAVSEERIDARFKDKIPQSLIDREALTEEINKSLRLYNCRNYHFVSLEEISPLVRTVFDGEWAYVPLNYPVLLGNEYGDGIFRRSHQGKHFVGQLRIWIKEEILIPFLRHPKQWREYYENRGRVPLEKPKQIDGELTGEELFRLQNLSEDELLRLLQHDEVFLRYQKTRDTTLFHEFESMRLLHKKSTAAMVKQVPDLPPFRYDPFLFLMRQQYLTFETKEARYEELFEASKDEIMVNWLKSIKSIKM